MTGEAQQKSPMLRSYIQRDDVTFDKQMKTLELRVGMIKAWSRQLKEGCDPLLAAEAIRVDAEAMQRIIGEYA